MRGELLEVLDSALKWFRNEDIGSSSIVRRYRSANLTVEGFWFGHVYLLVQSTHLLLLRYE
jgi:hypothetical protein